jgi:hypothetical protein
VSDPGIGLVDPGLAALIDNADDLARRRAVAACYRLALERTSLSDPRLDTAEEALAEERYGAGSALADVLRLVEELDEAAWDIQDLVEVGAAAEADYLRAFERARAAAAVGAAFDADSRSAGRKALYEAYFAIQDPIALRLAVTTALG